MDSYPGLHLFLESFKPNRISDFSLNNIPSTSKFCAFCSATAAPNGALSKFVVSSYCFHHPSDGLQISDTAFGFTPDFPSITSQLTHA